MKNFDPDTVKQPQIYLSNYSPGANRTISIVQAMLLPLYVEHLWKQFNLSSNLVLRWNAEV